MPAAAFLPYGRLPINERPWLTCTFIVALVGQTVRLSDRPGAERYLVLDATPAGERTAASDRATDAYLHLAGPVPWPPCEDLGPAWSLRVGS